MKYEPVYEKLQKSFLTYSNDGHIRFMSTAGGYISILIKHLFETKEISVAITFERDGINFFPKLIYSYDEYNNIGSIYQEIDIVSFFKKNINRIHGKILLTLLPCQINIIKHLAKQHNIEVFIISLVCSAQMDVECTDVYFNLIKVNKEEIDDFRYRGKGWPKYISIQLKNGSTFEENKLWNRMFHSYFFHKKKCLKCTDTFGVNADLSVSDPWTIKTMKNDDIGKSIVFIFSQKGQTTHDNLILNNCIFSQKLSNSDAIESQLGTMKKKYFIRNSPYFRLIINTINRVFYKDLMIKHRYLLSIHSKALNTILHILISKMKG